MNCTIENNMNGKLTLMSRKISTASRTVNVCNDVILVESTSKKLKITKLLLKTCLNEILNVYFLNETRMPRSEPQYK